MKVKVRKKKRNAPKMDHNDNIKKKNMIIEFLEKNKILFSVAALIISIITLVHGCQTVRNESKLNLPLFTIKQQYIRTEPIIDGLHYPEEFLIEYEIVNQGGELTSGEIQLFQMLCLSGHTDDYSEEISVKYRLYGSFLSSNSFYEPDTKRFIAYQHINNDIYYTADSIAARLKNEYPNFHFWLNLENYAKLTYTDYQGKQHEEYYDIEDRKQIDNPDPVSIWTPRTGHIDNFYTTSEDDLFNIISTDVAKILTK